MKSGYVVLLTMLLLLTSCAVTPQAPPVSDGFRCTVDIIYDGTEVSGVLDRTRSESTSLTLTHPQEVEGLTMVWNGQALALSYAGLSLEMEVDRVPAGAAVGVLCDVLEHAVRQSEQGSTDGVIKGNSACGDYEMHFAPETGYPLTLAVPSLNLSVSFCDWETK